MRVRYVEPTATIIRADATAGQAVVRVRRRSADITRSEATASADLVLVGADRCARRDNMTTDNAIVGYLGYSATDAAYADTCREAGRPT